MSEIRQQDLLLRVGGRTLQRFAVPVVPGPYRGRTELVETFSRADATTCATLVDRDKYIRQALAGALRPEWIDLDGDGIRETPGFLLEPQRTNSWLRSEEFDHATWLKTLCTITANGSTAPDGTATADHVVETTDGAPADHFLNQTIVGLTDNTLQSVSVFARAIGRTWMLIQGRTKSGTFPRASFNLSTGVIGTVSGDASAAAFIDGPFITVSGTVWYRCSLVWSANSGGSTPTAWFFPCSADNTTLYQGDGRVSLALWGAQFEIDQARPRSYIKTVAATVTRAQDLLKVPTSITPQAAPLTVHLEFIDRCALTGLDARAFVFSQFGFIAPYWGIQITGTNYRTIHDGGGGLVTSGNLAAATYGQRVRAAARLYTDGSTELERAIGAAAASTSTRSATTVLGTNWSKDAGAADAALYLGAGNGGIPNPLVVLDCRVFKGTFTLAECEAFA